MLSYVGPVGLFFVKIASSLQVQKAHSISLDRLRLNSIQQIWVSWHKSRLDSHSRWQCRSGMAEGSREGGVLEHPIQKLSVYNECE